MRWLLVLLTFLLSAASVDAQRATTDFQFWADYNIGYRIDDRWSIGGDIGARGVLSNSEWNQFLLRPGVSYRVADWFTPTVGAAVFSTLSDISDNVNEFRLYPGCQLPSVNVAIGHPLCPSAGGGALLLL